MPVFFVLWRGDILSSPNTSPPQRRGRPPKVREAPAPAPQPQGEMVVPIPLAELHPFPNHPFKVRDDEAMKETTESVKEYGVLTPAIVRPASSQARLRRWPAPLS